MTGRSALFSCWETRLTVGPTLQTASSLHLRSFLLETFSGASNAARDLRPAVNKMSNCQSIVDVSLIHLKSLFLCKGPNKQSEYSSIISSTINT